MTKLKSIEEYNKEHPYTPPPKRWQPFGVACPKCGCTLFINTQEVLMSFPPKRRVRCSKCEYTGGVNA